MYTAPDNQVNRLAGRGGGGGGSGQEVLVPAAAVDRGSGGTGPVPRRRHGQEVSPWQPGAACIKTGRQRALDRENGSIPGHYTIHSIHSPHPPPALSYSSPDRGTGPALYPTHTAEVSTRDYSRPR